MKLRRLVIDRLPGIDTPYAIEGLGEGVNVIHGPNASGKSSLMRALRALLYVEERVAGPHELSAEVEIKNERYTLRRALDRTQWLDFHGNTATPPGLPDHRLLSCYTIGIDDLLSCGGTEEAFAERLSRELSGGFDIRALRGLAAFHVRPKAGMTEEKQEREARLRLTTVRRDQLDLRNEADQLAALESEHAALEEARGRNEGYRLALDVVLERREQRQREHALERFDPICAKLSGDELNRLNELRLRERELSTERAGLEKTRMLEERKAASAGFTEPGTLPGLEQISGLHAHVQRLAGLAERRSELAEQCARARRQCDDTGASVRGFGTSPGRERVSVQEVHRAEAALERKRRLDAELRALAAERDGLRGRISSSRDTVLLDDEIGTLRQIRLHLLEWLRLSNANVRWRDPSRWIALLGAVSGAVALAIWVSAWAAFGLSVPLFAALGWVRADRRLIGRTNRVQAAVEGTGTRPTCWETFEVEAFLEQTEDAIRAAAHQRELQEREQQLAERFEQCQREHAVEVEALRAQAHELGLDPMPLDAAFDRWLRVCAEHDTAVAALGAGESELEEVGRQAERAVIDFEAELTALGALPLSSEPPGTTAAWRVASLERRVQVGAEAHAAIERAAEGVARIDREQENCVQAIALIYRTAGLSPGDEGRLSQALALLDEYRASHQSIRDAQATRLKAEALLPDDPEFAAYVEADDEAGLRERIAEGAAVDDRLTSVITRLENIRTRVEHAKASGGQEDAAAQHEEAIHALQGARASAEDAELGAMLLDWVEAEHADTSRPEVIADADRFLRRFTRYRFGLEFDPGAPAPGFAAVDHTADRRVPLSALSIGTRMQLLLALRLAFASELEAGAASLPLFVDEALATSDPERFAAIAQALGEVAQERQVLYLTAQPHEVGQWEAAGVGVVQIDLAEVRGMGETRLPLSALSRSMVDRADVPTSLGVSPEAYAERIGVGALDPWAPISEGHVFHVLRDRLPLLEALLRLGLVRFGPVKSFCEGEGGLTVFGAEDRDCVVRRIGWAERYVSAWRQGRGRPLRRAELAGSPVRPRFLDEMSALVDETGGIATQLIERLEAGAIKGFGAKMRGELAQWFETEGYLDTQPVLTSSERLARVLAGGLPADAPGYGIEEVTHVIHWLEELIELHPIAQIEQDAAEAAGVVLSTWTEPSASTR